MLTLLYTYNGKTVNKYWERYIGQPVLLYQLEDKNEEQSNGDDYCSKVSLVNSYHIRILPEEISPPSDPTEMLWLEHQDQWLDWIQRPNLQL